MDNFDVYFSKDLLQALEDRAIMGFIESAIPEEMRKQTRVILRAFTKRGVPVKTVLEACAEIALEGGFDNG